MYFSVSDLHPDSPDDVSITRITGRYRATAWHHEFARIDEFPSQGQCRVAGQSHAVKQNYPTPEARQGKWNGRWAGQTALP
jgi:hypothetical protein